MCVPSGGYALHGTGVKPAFNYIVQKQNIKKNASFLLDNYR